MMTTSFTDLIEHAQRVLHARQIASNAWAGSVAAALLTASGAIYTGVCIDVCSGMGFCAEHAAIAAMITAGESRILKIVAINKSGVIPPCGRCREFMSQIHDDNLQAEVMVTPETVVLLHELLPFKWIRPAD